MYNFYYLKWFNKTTNIWHTDFILQSKECCIITVKNNNDNFQFKMNSILGSNIYTIINDLLKSIYKKDKKHFNIINLGFHNDEGYLVGKFNIETINKL